ncbi:MAG: hypothetical protein K2G95_04150, partial [Muribaculaceae bacterium]|nr:hypothetical protein [Muribaculaceae bacterium]
MMLGVSQRCSSLRVCGVHRVPYGHPVLLVFRRDCGSRRIEWFVVVSRWVGVVVALINISE